MSAKLAEVYEKLKESRRQGGSDVDVQIGDNLREIYGDLTDIDLLVRSLEIKTLADRVFGDEEKADEWLQRPSAFLSGQRPEDLLQDELGAAVVREMLEQIDHGIFA